MKSPRSRYHAAAVKISISLVMLAFAPLINSGNWSGQAAPAFQSSAQTDRVVIVPRRIVLVRTGKIARDFPDRKRAVVRYPIVRGISDPEVLRRVHNNLAIKNAFGSTLEEYRQEAWLTDFDFKVSYNKNHLLDITFWQSGHGAYPDTHTKHFLISLKTGEVMKAADGFSSSSHATLAGLVNQRLRAETRSILKSTQSDNSMDADQRSGIRDQLDQLKFEVENLDEFAVSDRGVTFWYDAGFPHVIKALQPDGRYFFSFSELRPHIKADGPLGIFR